MSFFPKLSIVVCIAPLAVAQEWSEGEVLQRFEAMSPQAREAKARVAVTQAEIRTRALYPNPSASYSREGAGYTEFFQAAQTLPVSGRLRYIREAGGAEVEAAEADRDALLWSLRSSVRGAFYHMVAAQERVRVLSGGSGDIEKLIGLLRRREEEGEGPRYDRVRAERELAELRADAANAQPLVAAAASRVAAFLPDGWSITAAKGELKFAGAVPGLEDVTRRALAARSEIRAEQRTEARFRLEQEAARRLRIPEPIVSGGLKRADVGPSTASGVVFGITVPLPLFNRGQYEVSRLQAEQERVQARAAVIEREIRAEVQGALEVLRLRKQALETYQRELQPSGDELMNIAQIAYQEGEAGILELLDALRFGRNSRLRVLELHAAVADAWIELDRVVGEEVPR